VAVVTTEVVRPGRTGGPSTSNREPGAVLAVKLGGCCISSDEGRGLDLVPFVQGVDVTDEIGVVAVIATDLSAGRAVLDCVACRRGGADFRPVLVQA